MAPLILVIAVLGLLFPREVLLTYAALLLWSRWQSRR